MFCTLAHPPDVQQSDMLVILPFRATAVSCTICTLHTEGLLTFSKKFLSLWRSHRRIRDFFERSDQGSKMAIFILVDNVSELLTLPDRVSVSIRSSICHKRKFASIDRMIFTHAINQ